MDHNKVFIHPTALVDDGATIGEGSKIWHWSHISSESKIGSNVSIGQGVYVANDVVIGKNCKIQNNVSIFDNVTLGDDVFCGPSMVFTNVYNPRSSVDRKSEYLATKVRRGVSLGANCTIVCGITINEYAFIGAGAVVNKDVKSYALMAGVPAKQIGWISQYGNRLDLPLQGNAIASCEVTGQSYELNGDNVSLSKTQS